MTSKTGCFPGGLRSGKQPVFFLANSLYKKSVAIVILQLAFVISRSPREGRRLHRTQNQQAGEQADCCSPREGRRLHPSGTKHQEGQGVAVPVRGADCIPKDFKIQQRPDGLQSPRGAQIASAKRYNLVASFYVRLYNLYIL